MENLIILPQHRISKPVQAAGFVFFATLFWLCWHFYKERMLAYDGAYSDFLLISFGHPYAAIYRYGDWIPLLLPWLFLKLNLPLYSIVLIHSVSYIILHYAFFLAATIKLKNNAAGIAMMLISCLGYYHAFYNPMVELSESMMAGVLLWALIHPETPYFSTKERRNYTIAGLLVVLYMSFLHPLGIFIIAFVFGIEIIGSKRYKDRYLWLTAIIGIAWFMLKPLIFLQPYDQAQIKPLHELFSHASSWKNWPSTHFYVEFTRLHFRSLKWAGLTCLVFSFRKGILFFAFSVLFFAGFTFVVLSNYKEGTSSIAYEDYYMVYGFLVGLMLVFLFYHPRWNNLMLLLLLPLLWTGAKRIYLAHNLYSDRLAYIDRIVKQAHRSGEKKCLIDSRCYPYDYAMTGWDLSFETLLYSSLYSPDSSVTVFLKEPDVSGLCDSLQNKYDIFFGVHFSPISFKPTKMPKRYFNLPATPYSYLTHFQDDTSFHQEIYSAQNVRIIPLTESVHANVNDWGFTAIPIQIINASGHNIPAIPRSKNPVLVMIKLTDSQGNLIFDNVSNPLETDVRDTADCGVTFPILKQKGIYFAQLDIATQGVRKWNIPSPKVKVIID